MLYKNKNIYIYVFLTLNDPSYKYETPWPKQFHSVRAPGRLRQERWDKAYILDDELNVFVALVVVYQTEKNTLFLVVNTCGDKSLFRADNTDQIDNLLNHAYNCYFKINKVKILTR